MNEDREREEQRHPHHQDVRSGGAPDRAPRGVYFPGCEHGPCGESSNPALSDKMEPGGCLMRDRVGGDTQLQAVLLLYGLDIWMKKKSSIQHTDVSNYPHVGWHGLPQPCFLGGMFSGCSESWGSSDGSDSFSVVSVKMSLSLGLETRHAFRVPSATLTGNPPKIWNT